MRPARFWDAAKVRFTGWWPTGSCGPSVWATVAAGIPARNASALCWTGALGALLLPRTAAVGKKKEKTFLWNIPASLFLPKDGEERRRVCDSKIGNKS